MNHEQGKAMEPYGFIFGKDDKDPDQDLPLSRHDYTSYAPIASFYISDRFADIPWPTTEDWEAGESHPHATVTERQVKHQSMTWCGIRRPVDSACLLHLVPAGGV